MYAMVYFRAPAARRFEYKGSYEIHNAVKYNETETKPFGRGVSVTSNT